MFYFTLCFILVFYINLVFAERFGFTALFQCFRDIESVQISISDFANLTNIVNLGGEQILFQNIQIINVNVSHLFFQKTYGDQA